MKSIKLTFLLAIIASFTFISCENEPLTGTFADETGTIGGDGAGVFTASFYAKVDGVEFVDVYLEGSTFNNRIFVSAYDINNNEMSIGVPDDITEGTNAIDGVDYTARYDQNAASIFTGADSGSITIISNDTTAKVLTGSFAFKSTPTSIATPEFNVTEGVFSVSYE